jgi:purine-cytosine permease-like protein
MAQRVIRASRRPRTAADRSRALAEVEFLAWLLDNSIPVPGTGGRRFGLDALVGFVPVIGDLFGGMLGLVVVWRGSQMGLPRVVVVRMLVNTAVDIVLGFVPIIGDAFDLWFKVNVRNLALIRRYLEHPDASTRHEWLVLAGLVTVVLALLAAAAWLLVSLLSAVAGIFG